MPSSLRHLRLHGARQNNLKGIYLDLPLGAYIAVTGLSGTGKSSLVFDTLHAEGQRRYVETFSAYTRQFLELLPKPELDSAENLRPSIAIEQSNTVKTSRSTVGTMTELCDYFKVWFANEARLYDPATGEEVVDDTPSSIWSRLQGEQPGQVVLPSFRVQRPEGMTWSEIVGHLLGQGYTRALKMGAPPVRLDELARHPEILPPDSDLFVIQDRMEVTAETRSRFLEAVETAFHFGQGELFLFTPAGECTGHFSRGLHSPKTGRRFRAPTPGLFSFNSPLGACPRCRGFGRIIEIDYRLAIPNGNLSLREGAIKAFEGQVYSECLQDLLRAARRQGVRTDLPWKELSAEEQEFVLLGEPAYRQRVEAGETYEDKPGQWYGVKGFFDWLERTTYKMHVRIFLARYRAYRTCPECGGSRLQPESLCWQWNGRTLPDLYHKPVRQLLELLTPGTPAPGTNEAANQRQARLAFESILTRLKYLDQVGLGYLTLDRSSRTLSGGEVERVNLTSCLGTSLVDTLFVLDEPSVGLHARDIDRLTGIIRRLTDAGNTVVVVEHDEAMIRAADYVVEMGPKPGREGGHAIFTGSVSQLLECRNSLTGDYLSGRRTIPLPARRRPVRIHDQWQVPLLRIEGACCHNLIDLSVSIPLGRFVCLGGVSGSGKSTFLNNVLYQGWLQQRNQMAEEAAGIGSWHEDEPVGTIVWVDQAPLSRTPRSNPALYTETWDLIRDLFSKTELARQGGLTSSHFSFNSGEGRCPQCKGLGYEKVEMQFLSDVYIPCPVCEGRRFQPEILAIAWEDRSVADILGMTVEDALLFFASQEKIRARLQPLADVGLGYLTLGQPLNTLSGGESQRVKLVRHLVEAGSREQSGQNHHTLLLLDEPTTGLHRHDTARLLEVLQRLVDKGLGLVVIEHNADILAAADWIVELGPEAGQEGGRLVAEGTPEEISHGPGASAPYLRVALANAKSGRPTNACPMAAETAAQFRPSADFQNRGFLEVVGAREHNLKNLSLRIPHGELTVVTGVSGSGKSTLAFDIIFAEGQRRFMESMSPYARQFVEQLPRPELDLLTGIPPTVAIEQRVTRGSRKSTVATITEVSQYLRLLYARIGIPHNPRTGTPLVAQTESQLLDQLRRFLKKPETHRQKHLYLCAPVVRSRKGHHQPVANWAAEHGYSLLRVDGKVLLIENFTKLDRYREHDVEIVVADLRQPASAPTPSPVEALKTALRLGKGSCFVIGTGSKPLHWFSTTRTDPVTGEAFPELDPKHFSFNSPKGWCPACRGFGVVHAGMYKEDEEIPESVAAVLAELGEDEAGESRQLCPECQGERLNAMARAVQLPGRRRLGPTLPQLLRLPAEPLLRELRNLELDERGRLIARDILEQIEERLRFLGEVGLEYLALERPTQTLSGGEAQRIRLAAQLGSNLAGVLYVLDEPSIGLHARDNARLIETVLRLRDKGNTVLVVEHDDAIMRKADRIIDLGPGAGTHGGFILANDSPANLLNQPDSVTARYLRERMPHPLRGSYRSLPPMSKADEWIELTQISLRNLKVPRLRIPKGKLILVAGPSGAGKSTLMRDLLQPVVRYCIQHKTGKVSGKHFAREWKSLLAADLRDNPVMFSQIRGVEGFRSVVEVDQAPIGKTPRSTPATYLGAFDTIRQFFAGLPEAKLHAYGPGRFSFNTAGGRCETCSGAGRIKLEMAFLADTYLPCEECGGTRYGHELLDIRWRGKSIADVLAMTFEEAAVFFNFHSQLGEIMQLMTDTGLGYLTLGQSSPTLSGGEAQRLKLVTELIRGLPTFTERTRGTPPRNMYLLEEPTIGLHLSDCEKLIGVLHRMVDQGHTVMVIEHHLDLIAEADYVVEIGPGGGPHGGRLLHQGPVRSLLSKKRSPTAPFLRAHLEESKTK